MKKLNCNEKITDTEKNSPECTAPVNRKITSSVLNADPTTSTTYIFSEHLLVPTLLRLAVAIVLAVVIAFSFKDINFFFRLDDIILSSLLLGAFAAFLIFRAIAGIIQERKCFVCITPERIYGKIPTGILDAKEIDIPLPDVVAVENSSRLFIIRFVVFYKVELKIITKESEAEIDASSRAMLEKIGKTVINYIKKYK